VTDIQSTDADL